MFKNKKKQKEKYKYVFPNVLAKSMGKVSMRVQMEASMMSQFLLIIGLTIMVLYMIFTRYNGVGYTIMVVFNLLCGWVLISSYLVTTYQQYTNYMEAAGFDPQAEKEAIKKQGNIFKRIRRMRKMKKAIDKVKKGEGKKEVNVPSIVTDSLKNKEQFDSEREDKLNDLIELKGREENGG